MLKSFSILEYDRIWKQGHCTFNQGKMRSLRWCPYKMGGFGQTHPEERPYEDNQEVIKAKNEVMQVQAKEHQGLGGHHQRLGTIKVRLHLDSQREIALPFKGLCILSLQDCGECISVVSGHSFVVLCYFVCFRFL